MRTQLLPHNKTAYKKVMQALEQSDRTCVVHPTGTGKSYLMAAVSESYRNVLILGPNTFVLDQVRGVLKWRKRGVEYMTYQTLLLTENPHTDYDLICIDEFHRAGATEWGTAIDRLLEMNKGAKVFGATATPVRYLDNERNMAEDLFHGNIASEITIAEAWNRNILPIPRYVSGLFRWDKTVCKTEDRINRSRTLTEKEKRNRIFRLTNAHLHWELSYGMPTILRKHLDKDARRVIVFCGNIESLEQMRQEVIGWFRDAGFTIAVTCIMHSDLANLEQREQMRRFENDKDDGVKLMFSVNMLNEGIHVPNVNAVLMLRTTSSRIIYMQQMGRCLTAANTQKPLVLDMVDNITTTTAIKEVSDEFDALEHDAAEREGRQPRHFEVYDYTQSVRQLIGKLMPPPPETVPLDERIARLTAFCKEHDRVPSKKVDGKEDYNNWHCLISKHGDNPQVMALREQYGKFYIMDKEERLQRLSAFCEEFGRLPIKKDGDEYLNYCAVRDACRAEVDLLMQRYGKFKTFSQRLERLQKFIDEHDRLPAEGDGDEYLNYRVARRKNQTLKDPAMTAIVVKYDPRTIDEVRQALLNFHAEHGRLPMKERGTAQEINLYNKMRYRATKLFKLPELMILRQQRQSEPMERKILRMQEFTAKHGRKPMKGEKDYHAWGLMIDQGRNDPRVQELVRAYSDSPQLNMKNYIAPLAEFIRKEDRPPTTTKGRMERQLYNIYAHVRSNYADHPDVAALLEEIQSIKENTEKPIDRQLKRVEAFAKEHGRLPSTSKQADDEERRLARTYYNYVKRCYGNLPAVQKLIADFPKKMGAGKRELSFTKKQNRLRIYGKKYGYIPTSSDCGDTTVRFCIYYDAGTRRMSQYEQKCIEAGLTVKEYGQPLDNS